LPAADEDGSSDPYIELWSSDVKKDSDRNVTPFIEDNCNPIFFSALEIYYDFLTPEDAPPIILNIWDKDGGVMETDDFLGRAVIFLKDASYSQDEKIPEPKWHKIQMGFSENDPSVGEVLCSFSVVPDDYQFNIGIQYLNIQEYLEFKEFTVEINVLGMRNLQSFGLMPVKKAFIKFNVRSLLPPEQAKAVQNVRTNPGEAGANPNINTTITFTLMLPTNPLFCPKLSCDVYDTLFTGLMQPLLGTFSIPIGDVLKETLRT
jgi:hypothetical protein